MQEGAASSICVGRFSVQAGRAWWVAWQRAGAMAQAHAWLGALFATVVVLAWGGFVAMRNVKATAGEEVGHSPGQPLQRCRPHP